MLWPTILPYHHMKYVFHHPSAILLLAGACNGGCHLLGAWKAWDGIAGDDYLTSPLFVIYHLSLVNYSSKYKKD